MITTTISIFQDGVWAGDGTLRRFEDGSVDVECTAVLGPAGFDHETGAAQEAADRAYEAICEAIAAGDDRAECDGHTYTWETPPLPEPEVLGLGDDDWTGGGIDDEAEDAAQQLAERRQWERYGTVRVRIGEVEYEVGAAIGVPEHLRQTARAAGGDTITPYLTAWYEAQTDWSLAPASEGADGVPQELAGAVLEAIQGAARRLWSETL